MHMPIANCLKKAAKNYRRIFGGDASEAEWWPYDMANEYCQLAKAQKMEYTLLFCEIGGEKEAAKESRPGYIALGYDVAWTMGDFYSAVWHEILNMPGNHPDRKLNENGLFDTWKQANDFLESKTIIEGGTFSVVRIYKVV